MKKSILLIFIALMTAIGCQAQEAEVVKSKPTLRGYKAFYEAEYGFDIDNEEVDNNGEKISNYPHCNNLMISTTQGYQVNNFFFAGGGVGILHYVDGNRTVMPIFARILKPSFERTVGHRACKTLEYRTCTARSAEL